MCGMFLSCPLEEIERASSAVPRWHVGVMDNLLIGPHPLGPLQLEPTFTSDLSGSFAKLGPTYIVSVSLQ